VTLILDASVAAAALIDNGSDGEWARSLLTEGAAIAPHLMPVEVASILRRSVAVGDIPADSAALAHADLLALQVDLLPYPPFAHRVWELRENVTAYDGWYVAIAEASDSPLATLDTRLTRAPGPTCDFLTP
jgi:predicted nucleic acid-binding protein